MAEPNIAKLRLASACDVDQRRGDALEATWQITCLFDELAIRIDTPDTLQECSALRAFAARGRQLSGFAVRMLDQAPGPRDEKEYRDVVNAGAIAEAAHG